MKPTWIVQNNLGSTGNFETMQEHALKAGIPFQGVKIRPFTDDVPNDPQGPVVLYGACGMIRAASKTSLTRGIFDNPEGFNHAKWKKQYGSNILNYTAHSIEVGTFYGLAKAMKPEDRDKFQVFVRSDDDEKTIVGHVTVFSKLLTDLINRRDVLPSQKIVISPVHEIYAEYRCFIVDGMVVSASKYGGNGSKLETQWKMPLYSKDDAVRFANEMASYYCPHRIFVMDVCETDSGLKVVELNGFNSSGFYQCDIPAIMDAVNSVVEKSS
jgi:hypothetical protein